MRANCLMVEADQVPWKRGETEGLSFGCQVLLDGADGGPEALRFRFDPCPSVYAHMHLTAQFQLVIGGGLDMPRGRMNLRPYAVHYTDHNTPYGPFSVLPGHDMLVLHPKQGGLISMSDLDARRQINLTARLLVAAVEADRWAEWTGGRVQSLIPSAAGPEAIAIELAPGASFASAAAQFGRYEVVLDGRVTCDGRSLGAPGLRYVQGDDIPPPLVAGPEGAMLMLLSFDADALEGGLTGEGIAVAAAEAMAMAI
jgi:hypothetical protein